MTDEANTDVQVRKAFCSNCGGERNCEVRGRHLQRGGDDDFQWHKDWYILECRGCEHVFALTVSSNSEEYRNDYGPDGETLTDYIDATAPTGCTRLRWEKWTLLPSINR